MVSSNKQTMLLEIGSEIQMHIDNEISLQWSDGYFLLLLTGESMEKVSLVHHFWRILIQNI